MFQHLPSLKALLAFEAAARHASFNQAADELSVSAGAISYQVKTLEAALGVSLFHRRTRQVVLTEPGERLYRIVHRQLTELSDEIGIISPTRNESAITVSVSTFFVTRWLSSRLGRFLTDYPDITVRLQHSVNDPDFTLEDASLAIRWGGGNWPRCQSTPLLRLPMIALCSPQLAGAVSAAANCGDLSGITLLHDQAGLDHWPEWLALAGLAHTQQASHPVIVDPNVRVQSAIDGQGLVLANPLVHDDTTSGRLVEPLPVRLEGYAYHLVSGSNAVLNESVRVFTHWLQREADNTTITGF